MDFSVSGNKFLWLPSNSYSLFFFFSVPVEEMECFLEYFSLFRQPKYRASLDASLVDEWATISPIPTSL